MFKKSLTLLAVPASVLLMIASAPAIAAHCSGQQSQISFSLTRLEENPRQFSLVISDEDERGISGIFSVDQLQILRAIMVEAEKFSFTPDAAGAKEPITTRFMDKQESAFVVDVQKTANESKIFLTIKTEIGRRTLEAGKVIRSTRREGGFFFDLLSRLESVLPKLPPQPGK